MLIRIPLNKYFLNGNSEKISETEGNVINWWVKGAIVIISIVIYVFVLDTTNYSTLKWFWFILFFLVLGFDAFMEWRYLKDSKAYLVSSILLVVGVIYFFIFIFRR